jgi:hypothetical protein
MRKRLVALLSLVGFASSSTPATSQVLKGSSATPETKTESQVKGDKVNQENAAAQNDTSKKMRKAGGEQKAQQDVVTEKVGPDHIVHKHIAGVKYEKQKTESNAGKTQMVPDPAKLSKATAENTATQDTAKNKKFIKSSAETKAGKTQQTVKLTNADAASKDAAKMTKASTENTAIQDSQIKKVKTVTGESDAVKSGIHDKWRKAGTENTAVTGEAADKHKLSKANAEMGDGSVKPATAIPGSVKLEKNAAESKAAQQNLEKKVDKATPK